MHYVGRIVCRGTVCVCAQYVRIQMCAICFTSVLGPACPLAMRPTGRRTSSSKIHIAQFHLLYYYFYNMRNSIYIIFKLLVNEDGSLVFIATLGRDHRRAATTRPLCGRGRVSFGCCLQWKSTNDFKIGLPFMVGLTRLDGLIPCCWWAAIGHNPSFKWLCQISYMLYNFPWMIFMAVSRPEYRVFPVTRAP